MKFINKKLLLSLILFVGIVPNFWLTQNSDIVVILPTSDFEEDLNIENTQVSSNESNILDYIKDINKFLRFSIAWISMAVLVYAWIQLITAWWDKAKVSKWGKLALSCLIAIIVAMLSYLLVNLIVNLF